MTVLELIERLRELPNKTWPIELQKWDAEAQEWGKTAEIDEIDAWRARYFLRGMFGDA